MTRWKLTLEYNGGGFCGWQKQAHDLSVQQVLEEAVYKFSNEIVTIHAAGRTDAGVHALGQVAHFDLDKDTTADVVRDALNFHVRPHKVTVLSAEAVGEEFHARFEALQRRYRYQIFNRRTPSCLLDGLSWHVPKPLDLGPMQEAAHMLIGKHDFSTFRAQHCQSNSPLKTLDHFLVRRDGDMVFIEVTARSFLYHQVRNMAGTLMMVGTRQWTVDEFKTAFDAKDRTRGGPTAPPHGLFFLSVGY